jgi:Rieske Fe-S protein
MADSGLTRRRLLDGALAAACLGCAAVAGCAVLPYLVPPRGRGRSSPEPVATLDEIPAAGALVVPFRAGRAILLRREEGELAAFGAECTHLRCLVEWRGDEARFRCPCHGGIFDAEGRPVAGPPDRPLPRPQVRVRGRRIYLE